MTDRQDLIRFFSALDGGGDVVFVRPGDHTAGEAAQDAAEFLADRGHPAGVWLGWDRVGDDQAFAGGALVAPLTLWYGGEQARAEALLATLPERYAWSHEADEHTAWFTLSRVLSEEERAYPEPSDQGAVLERIGVIRAEDGQRNDPPKGYWDEDEEIRHGSRFRSRTWSGSTRCSRTARPRAGCRHCAWPGPRATKRSTGCSPTLARSRKATLPTNSNASSACWATRAIPAMTRSWMPWRRCAAGPPGPQRPNI